MSGRREQVVASKTFDQRSGGDKGTCSPSAPVTQQYGLCTYVLPKVGRLASRRLHLPFAGPL